MADQLTFVSVDDSSGKVKQSDRRAIRRQCMQGRNKRPDSQRSLRAARQLERAGLQLQENESVPITPVSKLSDTTPSNNSPLNPEGISSYNNDELQHPHHLMKDAGILQLIHRDSTAYPRELVSTRKLISLRDSNEIFRMYMESLTKMFLCIVKSFESLKTNNSPFLRIFHFADMQQDWYQDFIGDETYRIVMTLCVYAYKDYVMQRKLSQSTHGYHSTIVATLNAHVSQDSRIFLKEKTMHIISALAWIAVWFGQQEEFHMHSAALRHIVHLRGGRRFLADHPSLNYQLRW